MRGTTNPGLVVLAVSSIAFLAVGAVATGVAFVDRPPPQSAVSQSPETSVPTAQLTLSQVSTDDRSASFSTFFTMVAVVVGGRASAPSSEL
jgi:hypothetical protein